MVQIVLAEVRPKFELVCILPRWSSRGLPVFDGGGTNLHHLLHGN